MIDETEGGKNLVTRDQFIEALKGGEEERAYELIDKLYELAAKGDRLSIEYVFNQRFGGPKSTVVTEISDARVLAAAADAAAEVAHAFENREIFDRWQEAFRAKISGSSS